MSWQPPQAVPYSNHIARHIGTDSFVIRRWINLKRVPREPNWVTCPRWKPLYALNRVRGPRRIRDCREFLIQIIGRRPILAFHVPNTNASAGERRSSRSGVKCFHANEVADSGRGKVALSGMDEFVSLLVLVGILTMHWRIVRDRSIADNRIENISLKDNLGSFSFFFLQIELNGWFVLIGILGCVEITFFIKIYLLLFFYNNFCREFISSFHPWNGINVNRFWNDIRWGD